jgi:hypothetical protein
VVFGCVVRADDYLSWQQSLSIYKPPRIVNVFQATRSPDYQFLFVCNQLNHVSSGILDVGRKLPVVDRRCYWRISYTKSS